MHIFVYPNGMAIPAKAIEDVERFKWQVIAAKYKKKIVTVDDLYPPKGVFLSEWQLEQLAKERRDEEKRELKIKAIERAGINPNLIREENRQAWVKRECESCEKCRFRVFTQRDPGLVAADIILESKVMNATKNDPFLFGIPETRSEQAYANDTWKVEQSGIAFEKAVAKLCEQLGYMVQLTPTGADQGVDLILTGKGSRIAIQAKNYSGKVGNAAVQEIHAGKTFYHCKKGVVIANSSFTRSAIELARKCRITLVDGKSLEYLRNSVPYQPFGR